MDFDFLELVKDYCSMSPVDYQYYNWLFNHRTVIFNSDIDTDVVEKVWLPLKEFEEDDSNAPVTLILNSPGGSVSDGFFVANYLVNYSKKLNIIVTGYAASMAAIILAAGGKNDNITRYCYPSTYVLIHDGFITISTSENKTASDFISFNESVDKDIGDFIIANTNISQEEYTAHSRKQWFIKAKEAKELNLIDHIYGVDE